MQTKYGKLTVTEYKMEMEKRNFIKILGLSSAALVLGSNNESVATQNPKKIKAARLNTGDTVRIIASGTAVNDPDDLQKAAEVIQGLGLVPKYSGNLLKGSGYKTRTVKERVQDLHDSFLDKQAKAVFSMRGGYGTGQLLDSIDYHIIKSNPKIFCGYSDVTALHSAINTKTGLVTFHSPVLLSAFTPYTQEYFSRLLFNTSDNLVLTNPSGKSGLRALYPIRTINAGQATGELVGGNLSLISSLVGTDYQIDAKGKILMLEDVGEAPYRIDRMMNQLRLSGILSKAAAVVFGKCNDCKSGVEQNTWDLSLGEVLDYYLKPLQVPVFYGLMFGHTPEQITIPLGCRATVDSEQGTITLLESPVE